MKDRLFSKSASEVVGLLRRGEVSPLELIDEVEARAGAVGSEIPARRRADPCLHPFAHL